MPNILNNPFIKSLVSFPISILGPWIKTLIGVPKSPVSMISSILRTSDQAETTNTEHLRSSFGSSAFDSASTTNQIAIEVYDAFFWFIAMTIILEVSIFIYSRINRSNQSPKQLQTCYPQQSSDSESETDLGGKKTQKSIFSRLNEFIVYVFKTMLLYSFCYVFYTTIFAAICLTRDAYTGQHQSFTHLQTSFNDLNGRSLEEIYPSIPEQNSSIESNILTEGNPRFLQALNSMIVQPLFETQLAGVTSIILSANDTIAFLTVAGNYDESCSLQILNISTKSSPQFLGTIYFEANLTLAQLSIPIFFPLVLSPDGNTIFMSSGTALQIIDVSNLNAPTSISNYSLASNEYIQSIFLTLEGNYILLSTLIFGEINIPSFQQYAVRIVDSTNINSPQSMNDLLSPSNNSNTLYVSGESAFATINQSLLTFNLSNMQSPSLTSNLSFPFSGETILSLRLSSDYQTVFSIYQEQSFQNYLQIFNISQNALLNISQPFNLTPAGEYTQGSFTLSPDNIHLFVSQGQFLEILDISEPSNPTVFPQTGLNSENAFVLCSDGRTILASDDLSLYIAELILDIPASQAFQIQNNIFATITLPDPLNFSYLPISQIALSPDGALLYASVGRDGDTIPLSGYLLVANVSDPSNSTWISNIQDQAFSQLTISPDGEYLFTSYSQDNTINILIYQTSGVQLISNTTFQMLNTQDNIFPQVEITPDSNIALMLGLVNFVLYDISDRANPSILTNYTLNPWFLGPAIEFTKNSQVVIFAGMFNNSNGVYNGLQIYDISLPSEPKLLSALQFRDSPLTITLSADENFAFLVAQPDYRSECTLNVINISSLIAPAFITSMNMPISSQTTIGGSIEPIIVSLQSNTQILLIDSQEALIAMDISTPTAPQLLDYYDIFASNVVLAPDGTTLYIANEYNITITTFLSEKILYMNPSSVPLGAQSTNTLNVLAKNSLNTYDAKVSNFKFIDLFIYDPSLNDLSLGNYPTSQGFTGFQSLPNWVIVDKTNALMTLQPNSQYQIGSYNVYGALSTQIPNNSFVNVGSINNTNDSYSLLVTLFDYGYIDSQFYLTSDFDPTQPLILPLEYQTDESQYRSALAAYFLEVWTTINITSSLTITLQEPFTFPPSTSPIVISTESLEPLTVVITLEGQGSQPMFVTTGYSFSASFSQNNSVVSMVKSLADLNTTLPQLIIFLNGSNSCSGNITVTDGLNPTLSQFVPDLSLYFMTSSQPSINTSYMSSQIDKVQPATGEQFVIQFDSSTFTDSTNQTLTLSILMQDSNLQVPEWLELKGYTLTGTPPEQLTGRDFNLKLIVSNQYQSAEAEFNLSVDISIVYAFKMIGTIGGAMITVIGLLVYAPQIYNILCKRRYRYSKDFLIQNGQEIVPKNFYPILFAQEPLHDSRLITKQIDKKIGQKIQDNSRAKIASYFTISKSYTIDQTKLSEAIQESAIEIRANDRTKLPHFFDQANPQKEIITQLIINEFVVRLLDLETEQSTKKAFEEIKKELFSLVEIEKCLPNGLCTFSVNRSYLLAKLKNHNTQNLTVFESEDKINLSSSRSVNVSLSLESGQTPTKQEGIEAELIPETDTPTPIPVLRERFDVNIELLTAAIEAYACNNHIIDADITEVEVIGRRRLAKIWPLEGIRRFLKRDLVIIGFSGKALVGYGIKYKVQKNVLVFYGTVNEKIIDKTIVVQILSRKGKILREIWMEGIEAYPEKKPLIKGVL